MRTELRTFQALLYFRVGSQAGREATAGTTPWDPINVPKEEPVSFADKTLTCRDCGIEFTFTAGEQEFYSTKGLLNEPGRCPECRALRREGRSVTRARTLHAVTCAICGTVAEVPFLPTQGRPVYCQDCFQQIRTRA